MGFQFQPALVNWGHSLLKAFKKPHFALDAAYPCGATTLVHFGHTILVGKDIVVVTYRTNVRIPGIGATGAGV